MKSMKILEQKLIRRLQQYERFKKAAEDIDAFAPRKSRFKASVFIH